MNRIKRNIVLIFGVCLLSLPLLNAQTLVQAKALFEEGKYSEVLPAFEKYVKRNPSNAQLNYYVGTCLFETNHPENAEPFLKKSADRGFTDACLYLGRLAADKYLYDDAVGFYDEFLEGRKKKKLPTTDYDAEYEHVKLGSRMLKGTQRVQFIDSVVVNKEAFLKSYTISQESGVISTYAGYFNQPDKDGGTLYQTELGNKIWFGKRVSNEPMQLYTSDRLEGKWSEAQQLPGLETRGDMNYPYVLADGVTLYYAAKGEESLGGYDIFVTRFNPDSNQYLKPENLGMPFNSPANDYMYVIDEYNNLGWFATDRNQPDGKVCIYTFIPNESRQTFDYENTPKSVVVAAARLSKISSTQKDKDAVREAKQRLALEINRPHSVEKKVDFTYIINDLITYHSLEDFHSSKAKNLFRTLQQMKYEYSRTLCNLQKMRGEYAEGGNDRKTHLKNPILEAEARLEKMQLDIDKQETAVRNEELKTK